MRKRSRARSTVLRTATVLQDANGAATVVELRNRSRGSLVGAADRA